MNFKTLVSNCCGVPATVDGMEESQRCPECGEGCVYVDELINDGSLEHDLLLSMDLYSQRAGDQELINVLNFWLIKNMKKRLELHEIK